ncbi:Gfo/Idh/MocA family oxidoreductase [Chloroflexi bacterium TSY]|nr:Gfo/Idh/MocA family oxidoreductase [Chloroflexi bacterium TSY]
MINETVAQQNINQPIRLALVGAGIFARDAHISALLSLRDRFDLVAIYSRTEASAAARAAQWEAATGYHPRLWTDLDALLHQENIEAVDVVLPIMLLPDAVEQALSAGKHVISEKPIAPDVATGQKLIDHFTHHPNQVWMVAENWRYENAFVRAAEIVQKGGIGEPRTCYWIIHQPITPENKYFNIAWRHENNYQGGWLLDGGIHHMAALRTILGDVTSVTAHATLHRDRLVPLDTLSATLQFDRGLLGSYLVSYAVGSGVSPTLHIVGDNGTLHIDRGKIDLVQDGVVHEIDCVKFDGVNQELTAFAEAIRQGIPHKNTPHECLRDLALFEAMLQAAATGETTAPEEI